MQQIYLAGGCLWGVQEFIKYVPGVVSTIAGRANGTTQTTTSEYDGFAECVQVDFDPTRISVTQLVEYLFEIIDPYSVNKQGQDVGKKYRTGVYSEVPEHLDEARSYINARLDSDKIALEILPLTNFVASDEEHQHRLSRHQEDHYLCHIPWELLHKYRPNK